MSRRAKLALARGAFVLALHQNETLKPLEVDMSNRGMFLPYKAIDDLLHHASGEETGEYTVANTLWDMMRARNMMPTLRTVEKYHKWLKERKIPENDPRLMLVTEALATLSAAGGPEDMNTESNLKLCVAVKKGDLEGVKELIDAGANVGYTDDNGQTLLNYAIQNGLTDMALMLIDNGSDPNLALKIEEKKRDSLRMEGGSDLCQAVKMGDLGNVTKLIDKGVNVNYTAHDGYTPLRYAIEKGNNDIISKLIDSGANVKHAQKFAEEKGNKFAITKLKETESSRAYGFIGVPFFYNMNNGHGMLTSIGVNVSINGSKQSLRHLQLSTKVDHKAFLFITGKEDLSINDRIDMSLSSYLEQCNNPAPFATYPIPDSLDEYTYLVDFYKNMFRDMVDFVTYLHSIEISIDHFADDLTIKSIGVKKQKKDRIIFLVLLCDATPESKKEDFKQLGRLIKSVVTKVQPNTRYPAEYPADLYALLEKLNNLSPGNASWLKDHIVFLSTSQRNVFMHQVSSVEKHRQDLKLRAAYTKIIRNMIISPENAPNWTVKFRSGNANSPMVRCFNHTKYIGSKESMLQFIRNMAEHLCENFTPLSLPSMEEIQFIIMHYFGKELMSFQGQAASLSVLHDFL